VPVGTLRTWEARYGVPTPSRGASGHRRYREADVELVREAVRLRESGLAMPGAVARARSRASEIETSVFAALRSRYDELGVQLLNKPTVLALSRALEDECCAQADPSLLFASFQREHHYRASQDRWRDLSRTARVAVVFADFEQPVERRAAPPRSPVEVVVPTDAPLNREWVLVCDSERHPGCLVGWERPGQQHVPDSRRQFEMLWSLDPAVVRDAARVCARLSELYRPEVPFDAWDQLERTPARLSAEARRAGRVFDRLLAYSSDWVAAHQPDA
jgi:DICT domain-containing protein